MPGRGGDGFDAQAVIDKVTETLEVRYRGEVPRPTIEAAVREAVVDLAYGARVVDFLPVLAERRIRERLRRA